MEQEVTTNCFGLQTTSQLNSNMAATHLWTGDRKWASSAKIKHQNMKISLNGPVRVLVLVQVLLKAEKEGRGGSDYIQSSIGGRGLEPFGWQQVSDQQQEAWLRCVSLEVEFGCVCGAGG